MARVVDKRLFHEALPRHAQLQGEYESRAQGFLSLMRRMLISDLLLAVIVEQALVLGQGGGKRLYVRHEFLPHKATCAVFVLAAQRAPGCEDRQRVRRLEVLSGCGQHPGDSHGGGRPRRGSAGLCVESNVHRANACKATVLSLFGGDEVEELDAPVRSHRRRHRMRWRIITGRASRSLESVGEFTAEADKNFVVGIITRDEAVRIQNALVRKGLRPRMRVVSHQRVPWANVPCGYQGTAVRIPVKVRANVGHVGVIHHVNERTQNKTSDEGSVRIGAHAKSPRADAKDSPAKCLAAEVRGHPILSERQGVIDFVHVVTTSADPVNQRF
mmetsp:Transcript_28157/g.82749  ORF Transcript_28157/g.82749 Transcript_28157/m.82749 type:complete len:329 (+) Transcript_28157:125-1111(+)